MNVREWALPVYTILMQLATGTLFILWIIRSNNLNRMDGASLDRIFRRPVLVIFLTILIAILGSHFHLSQPLLSFLAVRNWRTSWLSREVLFTILLLVACTLLVDLIWNREGRVGLKTALGWVCVLLGSAGIFCMSSIYLLPTQLPWNNWTTVVLFFASCLLLGSTSAAALLVMDAIFTQHLEPELASDRLEILKSSFGWLAMLAAAALVLIVALNGAQLLSISRGGAPAQASLSLLLRLYQPLLGIRLISMFAGVGILVLCGVWLKRKTKILPQLVTPVYLACLLALIAEILGRFLFYAIHVRVGI